MKLNRANSVDPRAFSELRGAQLDHRGLWLVLHLPQYPHGLSVIQGTDAHQNSDRWGTTIGQMQNPRPGEAPTV